MIEINNLTKRFDKTVAINNLNCVISEGTIFGLAGSNGSGKSTLLRTLAGVYEPDGGKVIIDGQDSFDNHEIKERCYFISDYPYFFNDSTVENMAKLLRGLYKSWDEERYTQLCKMFPIATNKRIINTVSYTHLDVYKRQDYYSQFKKGRNIDDISKEIFEVYLDSSKGLINEVNINDLRNCLLYTS